MALLSRLPVHVDGFDRGARAAWAYPLIGLIIGGVAGNAGIIAHWIGLPFGLTALISLVFMVVLTGAMHEDGLADTADGLWGGWDRLRRLEIMQDSQIGTYGVLALLFAFSARWAALWALFSVGPGAALSAILVASLLSRATLPALMAALPNARGSGLSHSSGPCPPQTAWLAAALAFALSLLLLGFGAISATLIAGLAALGVGMTAYRKIGGQTGDILGAAQQASEIAVLLLLLT
ncbi:MAG: adenosylcobinamide-GDP ribazoletransferase [Pseudomonadota bacterium]|uniref:adenosylcobinamide-GDP ribazoletransferase n=1 Tax=Roseovarius TaxID=74030 RepID=UPI0022A85344|nr:adenosylcobinamide-GDP ribazoletransferase [Roseovarius sp. EGI FJ00037]MCZ0813391.1 adenosylcobinamide-GDP ribazoletransferase [Roseovarius sp. EGI FJ00037]